MFCFQINRIHLLLFLSVTLLLSCSDKKNTVNRSFYFWKTTYKVNKKEKESLKDLEIKKIYIRFFDVDWDEFSNQPVPVGKINFNEAPIEMQYVPVIYITNKTLLNISSDNINTLAKNITQTVKKITDKNKITYKEFQVDCDWTDKTKTKYFSLLDSIRNSLPDSCILTATIRLHQIKYKDKTGIPPIDRGMLMYYNMGQLNSNTIRNSIFNEKDAIKYTSYIKDYNLPLDLALPIFSWAIQIRNGKIINLLSKNTLLNFENDDRFEMQSNNNYIAMGSFYTNGIYIQKGDVFKIEKLSKEELLKAGEMVSEKIKHENISVILYDLDSNNLSYYDNETLEEVYDLFI